MYWDVTTVKPVDHLTLKVTFIDGLQGTVCFKPSFLTGVFESIKDESYFKYIGISIFNPSKLYNLNPIWIENYIGLMAFKSPREARYVHKVYVDHGVVTWPGELDLAPDAMHTEIKKHGSWVLE